MNRQQTGRLSPQSMLNQRYIILRNAGRGGMGAVYEAIDTQHIAQKHVAIKEMSQSKFDEEQLQQATERFNQEAAMLHSLSHPNLPRIHTAFSERGRSYLVMDFINGKNLLQILKASPGQPLPIKEVLHYACQLCAVLSYLHQHNPPIIFRDIKPTNIMVTSSGEVFLIDFGIARFFKEGQQQDTALLGSPGYASPEQHGLAQSSPRTDIYGLGATLHYCLTGQDPYFAPNKFEFLPIRSYNPQVPPELDQLVLRMVAQNELERPSSAKVVEKILLEIGKQTTEHTGDFNSIVPLQPFIRLTSSIAPSTPHEATLAVNMPPSVRPPQQPPSRPAPPAPQPPVMGPPHKNTPYQPVPNAALPRMSYQPAPNIAPPHIPLLPPSPDTDPINPILPVHAQKQTWTSSFFTLLAMVILPIVASFFALLTIFHGPQTTNIAYGWAFVIEVALAFLLVLTTTVAAIIVQNVTIRIILAVMSITALIFAILTMGLASPDVQHTLNTMLSQPADNAQKLHQLFTTAGIITALLPLLWLLRPALKKMRIPLLALFSSAILCFLVQVIYSDIDITKHMLLLIAFATLLSGVLTATQIERTRSSEQPQPTVI